jgi:preprotein translocase subunit SecA
VEGLVAAVKALGVHGADLTADDIWDLGSRENIAERLEGIVDEELERREQEHGADTWALVERLVLLRTIDSLWVEHLTEVDDMRRGIGLRGYGGTDPLNEFRREAFALYEELRGLIRHQVATTIFKVSVVREDTPAPAPRPTMTTTAGTSPVASSSSASGNGNGSGATAHMSDGVTSSGGALVAGVAAGMARPGTIQEQLGDKPVAPVEKASGAPKLGRNDPCYCGSGLKFKKCHGA